MEVLRLIIHGLAEIYYGTVGARLAPPNALGRLPKPKINDSSTYDDDISRGIADSSTYDDDISRRIADSST